MPARSSLPDIARVIQLSIAPVFLISGVSALLAVLSSRLGRTIDRSRRLDASDPATHAELMILARRAKLIYRAILLGTMCALLICCVIISLFGSAIFHVPISTVVAILFLGAMVSLVGALLLFLQEVFLATRVLRIGPR